MHWLVLAAGQSSRFGADKLLATMPDGRTVIDTMLAKVPSEHTLSLVTRPDNQSLQAALRDVSHPPQHVLLCPCAAEGLGSVMAWSLSRHPVPRWTGILLADMPAIRLETLRQLAGLAERLEQRSPSPASTVIAPVYQGQRGHPVLFADTLIPQLCLLRGDVGARHLLLQEAASGRVSSLEVDDPGILLDIDTPEALTRFHEGVK